MQATIGVVSYRHERQADIVLDDGTRFQVPLHEVDETSRVHTVLPTARITHVYPSPAPFVGDNIWVPNQVVERVRVKQKRAQAVS